LAGRARLRQAARSPGAAVFADETGVVDCHRPAAGRPVTGGGRGRSCRSPRTAGM